MNFILLKVTFKVILLFYNYYKMITIHKVYIEVKHMIKMALEGKYIDILGYSYDMENRPEDWVLHFCYKINDAETFINTDSLRKMCFYIRPFAKLTEAKEAFEEYKKSYQELDELGELDESDKKHSKLIFSGLEEMIKSGKKDLEINLPLE